MIRNFYKNVFLIKYRLLIGYFLLLIGIIIISKNYIDTGILGGIKISIFDMLCDVYKGLGIIGSHSYSLVIIPVFSWMLVSIIDCDNKNICVFRYTYRKNIWNKQVFSIIILSFVYSIIIIFLGYLLSGFFTQSFNNTWTSTSGIIYKLLNQPDNWDTIAQNFSSYKILAYIFISNFLGLTSIGMLICVLKMFMKNTYVLAIIIMQMYIAILFEKFSIVFKQMIVSLPNIVYPIFILKNDIYLIFFIVTLYILGNYVIEKKDFLT